MPLNDLLNILGRYRNASAGNASPDAADDYSQIAQQVPTAHLAGGLSEAFRSDQTPPFSQMLSTLFSNSNGQQRAGILNQLLGAVGSSSVASGVIGSLAGVLRGGETTVTPEQANQVSAEQAGQLAEHAAQQNPTIIDQASQFYAQHPTLVQALGAGSLALIMSHLSRRN
jgi:hypothetical protein